MDRAPKECLKLDYGTDAINVGPLVPTLPTRSEGEAYCANHTYYDHAYHHGLAAFPLSPRRSRSNGGRRRYIFLSA
jgi:hypothetical protein